MTTYTATAPDGTVFTANSSRPFAFATLVELDVDGTTEWTLVAHATRADLAMKNTNKFLKGIGLSYGEGRIIRSAQTVTVEVSA